MSARRARALRWLAGIAGTVVVLVGLIGLAHTPVGRPLMRLLMATTGCPIGAEVSPEQLDLARAQALAKVRGEAPSKGVSTPGPLELDVSTRADVSAWAQRFSLTCTDSKHGDGLECTNVPAEAWSGEYRPDHVLLQFDAKNALVAVRASKRGIPTEEALATYAKARATLENEVGPPTSVSGEAQASWLDGGKLRRTQSEFRYSNYVATVVAARLGETVTMYEQAQLIRVPGE